jgi:transketolase
MAESRSMRPVVAELLADLGDHDPDLTVLAADAHALTAAFARRHPRRFIDVGIAESNLVGIAGGLARDGRRVVVAAMAPFLVRRAAEQIHLDVCRPKLAVTLLGVGGGLSYGSLGASHHVADDIGVMSAMPNTAVFCPADVYDAAWAVRQAVSGGGPAYVRLGAREETVVHAADATFAGDEPPVFGSAAGALVVAAGATVAEALRAAEIVGQHGVPARVFAPTRLRPFPGDPLLRAAARAPVVLTVEDHVTTGGLAGSAAQVLAGRWLGRFVALAVDDRAAPALDRAGLYRYHGIDAAAIARTLLGTGHHDRDHDDRAGVG